MPLILPRVSQDAAEEVLKQVREKFRHFQELLENNSRSLKIISDMEEKRQGEYLFDTNYIRNNLTLLRSAMSGIVENLISLGGEDYLPLRQRLEIILNTIDCSFPGGSHAVHDDFIIPIEQLRRDRAVSVGSKSAQLGEMKSQIGLPVPNGFAVSGWAYQRFMTAGELQERIDRRLKKLDLKRLDDLNRVSAEIRAMVSATGLPNDLTEAIRDAHSDLIRKIGSNRIAIRSSAVGEDTHFSFAGQYTTFLNVPPNEIIDRYRDILAGKFTPQAIYYAISQTSSTGDFPMGVCFLEMVDAAASGVIYTRNPVDPENDSMLVSAIFGLGKFLVDGTITPDVFCLDRNTGELLDSALALKLRKLEMTDYGGVADVPVDPNDQLKPALTKGELKALHSYSLLIEQHYQTPRDIEFAFDREQGLRFLQSRPLRVLSVPSKAAIPENERNRKVLATGKTVCPGVASGKVHRFAQGADIAQIPSGCILEVKHPFPGIVTTLGRISALITEIGGIASHMATLAREYQVPTLAEVESSENLLQGQSVTVDATNGVIYDGVMESIINSDRGQNLSLSDSISYGLLQSIMPHISPLNLLHPSDREFASENCRTLHDITRFAHQRAMEEMFAGAHRLGKKWQVCYRLKSDIPLLVDVIFLDREPPNSEKRAMISEAKLHSPMLTSFWDGLREEGWPAKAPGGTAIPLTPTKEAHTFPELHAEYSTNCYTILSNEYMFLSLRMGYHFTTIEAFCTEESGKNYIRFQYKGGGASQERRLARIDLLSFILAEIGFENRIQGDFLDSIDAYRECRENLQILKTLGRLTLLTKQLDMALSNNAIVQWYKDYFKRKLGLVREA